MSDQDAAEQAFEIPEEIALLPLLNFQVYPLMVSPLAVGQPTSVRLIDDAIASNQPIALVTLRGEDLRPAQPSAADFYTIGTVALVHRLLRLPDGTLRVAIQGIERIRIEEVIRTEPYLRARISVCAEAPGGILSVLVRDLHGLSAQMLQFLPAPGEELAAQIANEADPRRLAYLIASTLLFRSSLGARQAILEAATVHDKLVYLRDILTRELAVFDSLDPQSHTHGERDYLDQARGEIGVASAAAIAAPYAPVRDLVAPQIRRVVANLPSVAESEQFYTSVLGLTKAIDLGWVKTFVAPNAPAIQVTLLLSDPAGIQPTISVEVDDVDAVYAAALAQGQQIVYPLTDEAWGVRRFFVRDPGGAIVNVLSHKP